MKVLVWHGDNDLVIYNATSEELAYQKMFDDMDRAQYWTEVSDPIVETDPPSRDTYAVRLRRLYAKAKQGDRKAARELCEATTDWENQYSALYIVQ